MGPVQSTPRRRPIPLSGIGSAGTGSSWRDLPEQFGAWQSVAERHLRWSTDGTYRYSHAVAVIAWMSCPGVVAR